MEADRMTYALRGKVGGDGVLGDLPLGEEVLLVVRAAVSKRADHYDDSVVVCDVTLTVVGSALVGEKASWRPQVEKALDAAAQRAGKLL